MRISYFLPLAYSIQVNHHYIRVFSWAISKNGAFVLQIPVDLSRTPNETPPTDQRGNYGHTLTPCLWKWISVQMKEPHRVFNALNN